MHIKFFTRIRNEKCIMKLNLDTWAPTSNQLLMLPSRFATGGRGGVTRLFAHAFFGRCNLGFCFFNFLQLPEVLSILSPEASFLTGAASIEDASTIRTSQCLIL